MGIILKLIVSVIVKQTLKVTICLHPLIKGFLYFKIYRAFYQNVK